MTAVWKLGACRKHEPESCASLVVMKRLCNLVLSLLVLAGASHSLIAAEVQPKIGEAAPAFSLASLTGDTVRLADFNGKFVVLHFGAGW